MSDPGTPSRDNLGLAVLAVAATYAYFLLFAEFSFLRQVRDAFGEGGDLRIVMAGLGGGGVAGSLLAWRRFRPEIFGRELARSYVACAAVASGSSWATGLTGLALTAAGIGLALGWNTVMLASGLRALVRPERLGWGIGLGTGAAYAFCNVPVIFTAGTTAQAGISAGLTAVAALGLTRVRPVWTPERPSTRGSVGRWVAVFLALVWLDSAAFYIIQQTPELRGATWAGLGRLWGNVAAHLGAALLAGRLLDRGGLRGVAGAAWLALAVACFSLGAAKPGVATGFLYASGVSLYSTALVYFAARDGRPAVAAAVFAVAGWIGSALGIGLAQDLHVVPPWFVAASGAGLALALRPWRRAGVVMVGLLALVRPVRADQGDGLVARGREVYIAEGCMHCHSQYVRPGVRTDVERWGPARPLEDLLQDGPPLPGNRRQGPDLTNVGNRRSPEWNRLHLQEPRMLSPGSRMPSYRHLFTSGAGRGEALVAYLASLGDGTAGEHWGSALAWRPVAAEAVVSPAEAAKLFAQNCVQCHGAEGRGDGPLVSRFLVPPPDWSRDAWRRVPHGDVTGLARVIKFGLPGTAMAGHEAFADAEILGLARHVKLLHK